ncbi:MAG TPA: [FeFe] hydrogenase H-cluster radical SAM maturase HydG [Candidatus Omnitrophota bacterium]|nr:[FeFe] hydrogenase H-cluster radical SAM maturase HydG [Candidatus Omnitrophota bacterium]HPT07476.1 [FeFe] hydrogenase H-cluster radical SAM maturase HydG [Candidatus Omnitrophota bacterium]
MLHINESKIEELLHRAAKATPEEIERILQKSLALQRLTLQETAALLAVQDKAIMKKICIAAADVKERIYGKRVVLFAPLYISNLCSNACLYCAFKADNTLTKRRALTMEEIRTEIAWLLKRGHKRILMVSGEAAPGGQSNIDYCVEAVETIYSVSAGPHKIKRVNVNLAPLSIDQFKKLKKAGIGTYQIFQETYHEKTYRHVHPIGPKSDPDNRVDAVDRAFLAGIDDIGIGVLYGLYDWRFETLALLMHVEHMEKRFNVGPHTISVPRIEPAEGVPFVDNLEYKVSDDDFRKIVAVMRLSVPYTGLILSTRESPAMRDELFNLGISQVSAESRTAPGAYSGEDTAGQFSSSDLRSMDEVVDSLLDREFIPSFCAACYRKERTGEAFMNLAKPGTIKGKCSMNALITLKEYLDDFASEKVRLKGYRVIEKYKKQLISSDRKMLDGYFSHIDQGTRDEFV